MPRSCTSSNFHLSRCFFLLSILMALCLPLSQQPHCLTPPHGPGAQAGRQLSLVQTLRGADLTAGTSWERTCCRSWLLAVESSPAGARQSQSHDPALRHSSPLPPPLLSFPVSCSSPPAFASPMSTHLHVRLLLRAAAMDEAAQQPPVSRLPAQLAANTSHLQHGGRPLQSRPAGKPCA